MSEAWERIADVLGEFIADIEETPTTTPTRQQRARGAYAAVVAYGQCIGAYPSPTTPQQDGPDARE